MLSYSGKNLPMHETSSLWVSSEIVPPSDKLVKLAMMMIDHQTVAQASWRDAEPSLRDGRVRVRTAGRGAAQRPASMASRWRRAEEPEVRPRDGGLSGWCGLALLFASGGARRRAPPLWFADAACQRWGSTAGGAEQTIWRVSLSWSPQLCGAPGRSPLASASYRLPLLPH